jgi:hypothetical protein
MFASSRMRRVCSGFELNQLMMPFITLLEVSKSGTSSAAIAQPKRARFSEANS